jgi:hypothetical protein
VLQHGLTDAELLGRLLNGQMEHLQADDIDKLWGVCPASFHFLVSQALIDLKATAGRNR